MAKKMSNKARIQQKADEAAAPDKEKAVKKKKVTKKKVTKKKVTKKKVSKKKAAAAQRMKVVWKVFNANYKEVGTFLYPEKKKAYKLADDMIKKDKGHHFVNAVQVPMEED